MAYATQQDLIDRFGETELLQLTDRTNMPPTTIDATVVARALSDASDLVDSYCAKRYKLPLDPVPSSLTKTVCDIARFYLHGDRAEEKDPVRFAYKDAVNWLEGISKGLIQLEAAGVDAAPAGGGQVRFEGDDRQFSRDSLKGL